MLVGLTVPLLAALIGIPMGAAAGWYGGRFDALFLRVVEIMTAIPLYMLAIILRDGLGWRASRSSSSSSRSISLGRRRPASRGPRSSRSSRASTCSRRGRSGRRTGAC